MSRALPGRVTLWSTLGLSVFCISAAAPLIVAAGAPAAVTSLWRMAGAGLLLLPWVMWQDREALRKLTRGDLLALFISGNLLALHYLFWIGSLSRTSVVSSTVLVTTNPLWVGLGAWLLLHEPPSKATWVAILVGIAGAVILGLADAGADSGSAHPSLVGDAMALAGALAGSGTLLFGRTLRARVSTSLYQAFVCLGAVPLVLAVILATGVPLAPASSTQILLLLVIVIAPQLIGNTILSWALGYLTAPQVALIILGEPIVASLLAWGWLGQTPRVWALPGAVLVLFAVVQGARNAGPDSAAEATLGAG